MKKVIITAAMALAICTMQAQVNTGTNAATTPGTGSYPQTQPNVPASVNAQYGMDNPNTSPTWSMDGSNYSATWMDRSTNMSRTSTYDKNGTLINSDSQMSSGSYPSSIGDYYTQNYPGEDYTVWSSKDKKGNTTYYTTRNGKKIKFDKDGNYASNPAKSSGKTKSPDGSKTGTKTTGQ